MKLVSVDKILKISIKRDDLSKYLQALKGCINEPSDSSIEPTEERITLTRFATELDNILKNAMDY